MKSVLLVCVLFLAGCSLNNNVDIYQGEVRNTKIKVSSQTTGIITNLSFNEGDNVKKGEIIAKIDADKLVEQLKQKKAQLKAMDGNISSIKAQIEQIELQLKLQQDLLDKTSKLLQEGASTVRARDEINTQTQVLKSKVVEAKSRLISAKADKEQLLSAIELVKLQIKDTTILSPINGTILTKYFNQGEMVGPGSPLMEIADLSQMEAKIYLPLKSLSKVKVGQTVKIKADSIKEQLEGKVSWISSQAEFTPKTILTKETRTTLIYAVKVMIKNEKGILKIGQPIDVTIGQ